MADTDSPSSSSSSAPPSAAAAPVAASPASAAPSPGADARPPVWVGHIHLTTDRLAASHDFMVALGMRSIFVGDDVAVLELRAGTHLVLMRRDAVEPDVAPFDLMVEDLAATHAALSARGLSPSPIDPGRIHDSFTVRDPSGHIVKFNSSHVSDQPV